MNLTKISFPIYFSAFILFVLFFNYTPRKVKDNMLYSCLKIAKENCIFDKKNKAIIVLKQCKMLVRHKQDLHQIKNSYHCKRKKN